MAFLTLPGTGRPGRRLLSRPARSTRHLTGYLLIAPVALWLALFFLVPLVTLLGTSLQTPVPGGDIGEFEQTFRLANYLDVLGTYSTQFVRSFVYAGLATVLALLISYPLAFYIAQRAGRWRNVLLVLVVAPFYTSFVLRTIAWRQILGEEGWVSRTARVLHLLPEGATITASSVAVVLGLTYNFLPFMTLPLYASLERIDPQVIEAGGDLYAGTLTTFRTVVLPLSLPGVVAGTLLTFIPAAGDYVNAALLGRPSTTTMVGNVVESRFFRAVDYPGAAVLSVALMTLILVIVVAYVRRAGTEDLV